MKQMNIDPDIRMKIDFTKLDVPKDLKDLQPVVYRDGNSYCCLLGANPKDGIFGCGDTSEEAIRDWRNHLKHRIYSAHKDDEFANVVKISLNENTDQGWYSDQTW